MARCKVNLTGENPEFFDFKLGDHVVRMRGDGDPGIIVGGWSEYEQEGGGMPFRIIQQVYIVERANGERFQTILEELRRP